MRLMIDFIAIVALATIFVLALRYDIRRDRRKLREWHERHGDCCTCESEGNIVSDRLPRYMEAVMGGRRVDRWRKESGPPFCSFHKETPTGFWASGERHPWLCSSCMIEDPYE